MVDNERIYMLYESMMKVEFITTKEIKELGFTQHEIAKLVEEGILIRVQRGFYNFGNVDSLYLYGKSLIDSKKREEGLEVFKRCYALDSTNVNVALQLMLNNVKNKEYDEILKYYDVLYNSDNTNIRYLYYLYLISFIIELPEHYKDIVKDLKPQDLMVEEIDPYTRLLNNTIGLVFNGKLPYAYSKRAGWHSDKPKGVGDYTEITILKEAVACNVEKKKRIESCIIEENYDEAIELLSQEAEVRELPVYNKYVNFLLNDIVRMINFKEVHDVVSVDYRVGNLFVAIDNYDYELAIKLSEEHNKANNMDNSKSLIYVLLDRIIKLKKEILNIVDEEEIVVDKNDQIIMPEVIDIVEETVDKPVTYSQVVGYILSNDEASYATALASYLRDLGVPYYYSLITSLIEINKIKGIGINKILTILTQIANDSYVFNENEYIDLFYESVIRREFEVASLYLIILEAVSSLSDDMISELNNVMKMYEYQNSEVLEEALDEVLDVNEPLEGQLEMDMSSTVTVPNGSIVDSKKLTDQETYKQAGFVPIAKTKPFRKTNVTEEYRQDEEFIDAKIADLKENRGLIVLKPMDNVRRKRIHDIVSHRKDAATFSIGNDTNRRIVLRFVGNVYIPLKETIKIADEAYYRKDYETALRAYLDILGTNNPKTFIYAKVGLTYMKMWKIDKAIEYLTVATELSKQNNEAFDFSDLIASLDGTIEQHEKKPKVKFRLEEFSAEDNFGVDRIDEMLTYKELNEVDYEEACEQMGFTYEEYLLSLLVLAKRAYENKQDDLGDKFLKMVERSGNKSKKVILKFQEVQKNKKFYKNRGHSMVKKDSE